MALFLTTILASRFNELRSWACALLILGTSAVSAAPWAAAVAPLKTRWTSLVTPDNVLPEYPRPQCVRSDWMTLNGLWDYAIGSENARVFPKTQGEILVPFPVESALSGVMKKLDDHSSLWYRRQFSIPSAWKGRRVRLHFGAVDWLARVRVNGQSIGEHRGGYNAFTYDITDYLNWDKPEELVVRVTDPTEGGQPRGKQSLKPEGIFYTACSGIWQTVWLEPVPEACIDRLELTPDLAGGTLKISVAVADLSKKWSIEAVAHSETNGTAAVLGAPNSAFALALKEPRPWSPEDPFLYDLEIRLKEGDRVVDTVTSYFGMRQIQLQKDTRGRAQIALNGHPIMQIGALDQGYWPDGLYTAPSDEAMWFDLNYLKCAGFNMVRKHVKVEQDRWYYWCDKMGLLVWQDMPVGNNEKASSREAFEIELGRMVEQLRNHPSIVQWVLFNEGWGQYDTERLSQSLKTLDPTRLIDNASGWTDMQAGDIIDIHRYTGPESPAPDSQRAIVLGEYGGICFRVEDHCWSAKSWGYQTVSDQQGFNAWYSHLLKQVWALHDSEGLGAVVYTQLTDVETECNGLMTYDREVMKIDPVVIFSVNRGSSRSAPLHAVLPDAIVGQPVWSYTESQPANDWLSPEFDADGWKRGAAGFGTPSAVGSIVRTEWKSPDIWLRRKFMLSNHDLALKMLKLEIHHDDDAEVYINGVPAFRAKGFLLDYAVVDLPPEARAALKAGENTIAVHCHQFSGGQYIDVGLTGGN